VISIVRALLGIDNGGARVFEAVCEFKSRLPTWGMTG